MEKTTKTFLTLFLLIMGTMMSWADFKNFSAVLNNQDGTLLTAEEQVQGTAVSFGVAVDDAGNTTRVAADDATAVATISGKYHSDHGMTNLVVTVPVSGNVKILVGQCTYSGSDIVVKNSDGTTVASKSPGKACWKNDRTNITEVLYAGEATTLTVSGMGYCPYIAVEKNDNPVTRYDITYSLGEETATGTVPANVTWTEGDTYNVPKNFTLYKEGYTLTGWTDGSNTVKPGEAYTPAADVTLTPIFTQNTKTLADRKEPLTLKWSFRRDEGAPTIAVEGSGNGIGVWVTQATVDGETIDVKMDYDATSGKINNANNTDWAQMNNGTKLTIPSAKGTVVSMEAYNEISTTTIDGQSDYTHGNTISYNIANTAEAIDIVIGNGSYYRYIQAVLPLVQEEAGGKTYTNEPASVVFAMSDQNNPGAYTSTPTDGFSTVSFDSGDCTITGATSVTKTDGTSTGVTGIKFKPAATTKSLDWFVRPAAGLTFTPTRVQGYVNRCGTDAEKGIVLTARKADGSSVALGTFTAWRQGKSSSNKAYDSEAIYMYDITLTAEQQAQLAGTEGFYLTSAVGVSATKEGLFGEVTIEGTLNGTIAAVNKYTVGTEASPAEGGEVSIYPNSAEYIENDEVTLTATEAFGYDFVNWTDKAGNEVSTEAKFKYTVTADETLTANFKKVNTYALDIQVEGGANGYMVSLSPEPTVVDGKNMYEEGTKVIISASSNNILTFTNWSNGETAQEMPVIMNEDKAFTASYSAIDYIVGWDFITPGGNGRAADFAAAENDAVSLIMRNESGETSGWLDKSQQGAGGYEGRPGAVNWRTGSANGDVGHWYWQTMVNASAFTDIKVITSMVYNYNAYTTQLVEYSLDGETWETAGKVTLEGAKKWADATITLPAAANNQPKVYIRWISDKTSKIDGTASANDGITLGATYITGTAKLIDDGTAPKLVSSVPENNGTGASANGKVVLTFDEKVKLTANAKAAINGEEVAPTVSGKTVICEYKGLPYSSDIQFVLYGGSVSDLTDNTIAEDITINFQTKVKPTVEKALYDFVVGTDGTLPEAIAAANAKGSNNNTRYRILIPAGSYVLPAGETEKTNTIQISDTESVTKTFKDPTTYITASNISFIGTGYSETTITNSCPTETVNGKYGEANISEGIGKGDVLSNSGTQNYFQGLTVKTSIGDARGRDIALNDKGNKTIFKDACLWGYQDTYVSNNSNGKFYFEGGVLRGRTDYLCGKGDVFYNGVTLQQCGGGGYLAVPSQAKKYGYVFNNCYIKKETSDVTFWLGRPWGSGTPTACFINTKMDAAPLGNGWADMSGGWPARFAEYNSFLTSGTSLDLSGRRTSWTGKDGNEHPNDPILTLDDVKAMSLANVMGQDDDWDPTALTEQASAPANVKINAETKTLTWDDNNYVLCWVLFKDGKYVTATTTNSYEVDDASATWTVRAANEMGGLGEATTATVITGVDEVKATTTTAGGATYNLAGQRVNDSYKGTVIKNSVKFIK